MRPVYRSNMFAFMLILGQVLGILFLGRILKGYLNTQQLLVATQIIFLIIPAIVYFIITGLPVKDTLRLNKISLVDAGIIIIIALLCQPIANFLSSITNLFFKNLVSEVFKQINSIPYVTQLGIMALTPAVCEEITMRGIVLSGYRQVSKSKAAVMTGLLFGILHMNLQQFLYAFVLGILLAYLVMITDSIFSSMICHFTFNGTMVTISALAMKFYPEQMKDTPDMSALTMAQKLNTIIPLLFISIVASGIIFMLLMKLYRRNKARMRGSYTYDNSDREFFSVHTDIEASQHEIGYLLRGGGSLPEENVINAPFIATIIIYALIMYLLG